MFAHLSEKKNIPIKKYDELDGVKLKKESQSHFSHKIWITKKPKKNYPDNEIKSVRNEKKWVTKLICDNNLTAAMTETIAQEFFRFIMPWHPKTRTALIKNRVYILSEMKESYVACSELSKIGFQNYDEKLTKSLLDSTSKARADFAEILVISLFLHELDLRWENLGFTVDGRMIKIDGELCFGETFVEIANFSTAITAHDLDDIANFSNSANWLNKHYKIKRTNPRNYSYLYDKVFCNKLNSTLLTILLLPNYFFENFTQAYSDNMIGSEWSKFMISRRNALLAAALKLETFSQYLMSDESEKCLTENITKFKAFKTTGKNFLYLTMPTLENDMSSTLCALKKSCMVFSQLVLKKFENAYALLKPGELLFLQHLQTKECNNALHLILQEEKPDVLLFKAISLSTSDNMINQENHEKKTALMLAINIQHREILKFFIDTDYIFKQINHRQCYDIFVILINHNENDFLKIIFSNANSKYDLRENLLNTSLLRRLVEKQVLDFELFKLFCKQQVDFGIVLNNETELSIAIKQNHHQVVQHLLIHHVDAYPLPEVLRGLDYCMNNSAINDIECKLAIMSTFFQRALFPVAKGYELGYIMAKKNY